jgi:hypothetical protein
MARRPGKTRSLTKVDDLGYSSFRELITQKRVVAREYERFMESMEAADHLVQIEQLGDQVIGLAKQGTISRSESTALLDDLMALYADPLQHLTGIIRISRELRRFGK